MPWAVLLAGLGLALLGWVDSYAAMFLAVAVSGIGVAAFHWKRRAYQSGRGRQKSHRHRSFRHRWQRWLCRRPFAWNLPGLSWRLKKYCLIFDSSPLRLLFLQQRMWQFGSLSVKAAVAAVQSAPDNWPAFGRLSIVVICRSILSPA